MTEKKICSEYEAEVLHLKSIYRALYHDLSKMFQAQAPEEITSGILEALNCIDITHNEKAAEGKIIFNNIPREILSRIERETDVVPTIGELADFSSIVMLELGIVPKQPRNLLVKNKLKKSYLGFYYRFKDKIYIKDLGLTSFDRLNQVMHKGLVGEGATYLHESTHRLQALAHRDSYEKIRRE